MLIDDGDRRITLDVLKIIFEALPTPVYFKDIEGRFITCNNAFAELNELTREEIMGKTAFDLFDRKVAEFFAQKDRDLIRDGGVQVYEHSILTSGGQKKSILAQKKLFFDESGNPAGTFAIISDISEFKKTERDLKILSEKYAQVFNVTTDALFLVEMTPGKELRYAAVNKAFLTETGLLECEVLGKSPQELFGETTGFEMDTQYSKCIENMQVLHYRERVFLPKGEWWDTTLSPVMNEEGCYILGSSTDVTDQVLSEKKLQESEEKFRKYVEFSPNSIFVLNDQGKYIFANGTALKRLGYTQEEFGEMNYQDLLTKDSEHDGFLCFSELVEHGEAHGLLKVQTKDGTIRNVLLDGVRIQKDRYLILSTDLTERIAMETQLKRAKDSAEAANKAKGQFLANMSHEIRTPMNGIIGMTELALLAETSGEQREYLDIVKRSAGSLLKVLNDILDYSQVEAGKITLDQKKYRLRDLMWDVTELFEGGARQKGLYLRTKIHESVPAQILGDPVRLRQVLSNLIGNGIKFTAEGGVDIRVEKSQLESKRTQLRFEISDTGIGIPEQLQEHLFKRFSRVENAYTREQGGAGLGLAISKGLVEMMGGEIGVISVPSQGSRFYFTIDTPADEPEFGNTPKK